MPTLNDISLKYHKRKQDFILSSVTKMEGKVDALQVKLFDLILESYLPKFKTNVTGTLQPTAYNVNLTNEIESIYNQFHKTYQQDVLSGFTKDLLKITPLNIGYYKDGLDIADKTINSVAKKLTDVKTIIGIDDTGKLLTDGYLYRLGKSEQVRQELKNYVMSSVTTSKPYNDYLQGFKTLVKGKGETEGSLQKYYRQYAYDTFNKVDAITDKQLAEGLGLTWGIYEGSLIKNSRKFCIKRSGNMYHVSELPKWKDDPDLVDKKTKDSYNPIVERGRYNCRHFWRWISNELAQEFDAKKYEEVTNANK